MKTRSLAAIAILAVTLLAISPPSGPVLAASFDCAKAATPDEKAICATPALSDLDTRMATLHGVRMQIPMLMGARGAAQDEQRTFLDRRGACGADVRCLGQIYQARIEELNRAIGEAMQDYCVKLGICG